MFLEVSAKSALNVEESFTSSAKQILQNIDTSKSETNLSKNIKLDSTTNNKEKQVGCGC